MYQILIEIAILFLYTIIMLSYFYKVEACSIKRNELFYNCIVVLCIYIGLIIMIPSLSTFLNIMVYVCIFSRFVQMSGVGYYKAMYFVGFYIFLLLLMNIIVQSLSMILIHMMIKQGSSLPFHNLMTRAIVHLVFVISLGFESHRLYPDNIRKLINQNEYRKPIIVTMTAMNILLLFLCLIYNGVENIWGNILNVVVCVVILFCYAFFENYLSKSYELCEKLEDIKFIEQRLSNQYSQYEEQNEYVSSLRKVKHDISNALINITYLLQDYKYEDALSCIQACNYDLSIPSSQFQTYSDNYLLNADLRWIGNNLKSKGIGFSATVKVGNMDMKDKEIWSIILDLLDQASIMSEKVSDHLQRYVNIRGNIVDEWLVINIENRITKDDVIYHVQQNSSESYLHYSNTTFELLKMRIEELEGIMSVEIDEKENLLKVTVGIPSYKHNV